MATGTGKKGAEDEDESASGGRKKLVVMAVAALAVVGGVYKFVLASPAETPSTLSADELAATMSPEEKAAILEPPEGEIVQMEEMILNLSGPEDTFLKIRLALVLDTETVAEEFEAELPIAQDLAVQYLSSLQPEDLRTTEGKQKAKNELGEGMKAAYKGESVVRVLITALVMQ